MVISVSAGDTNGAAEDNPAATACRMFVELDHLETVFHKAVAAYRILVPNYVTRRTIAVCDTRREVINLASIPLIDYGLSADQIHAFLDPLNKTLLVLEEAA
jgi:hypothetical protein